MSREEDKMDEYQKYRNSLLMEAFRTDSEIIKLQDHVRNMLQMAVDRDMQRFGYVEKITMDTVRLYHYDIVPENHKIYPESMFKEDDERYRPPYMEQEAGTPDREQAGDKEHRYITYATLPGSEKETVLEGNDLGELFAKWKEMEGKQEPGNKIRNVFVIDTTAQSDTTRKYEIATGKDVTPVYLKFPEMSGDDTERVTQWLKENGAEYNEKRNLWYIGRQDKEQFLENFRQYARESRKKTKPEQEKSAEEKKYYSYAYNADGSMSRFTGNSIEAVAKHWQETAPAAPGRGKSDRTEYFYIREKNAATGQLGEASRYETATGRDVTPVYLSLPHMSRENFVKTTQYLKENGAKFSSTQKSWYVTKDQDLSRFKQFLQKPEARESTVRKLTESRKEIAAQAQKSPASERKHEAAR
ncbi:MAG: hypothetical protein K2I96_10605 [Lachnospiraceae bacterium]|nr:hypothetical protein [Lachnospiraceae bacterium]